MPSPYNLSPPAQTAHGFLAAIDLGTNNCRLLIARTVFEGYRVVEAFSRIVRLGEGLSFTDQLSAEAMQRTLAALEICADKMAQRQITQMRAVATEACRRAANGPAFLEEIYRTTGIRMETISVEEEARLALAGCRALLDPTVPFALVFDIGGGSTELLYVASSRAAPPRVLDQISLPVGVVSLAERYGGDTVSPELYAVLMNSVTDALQDFEQRNRIAEAIAAGAVQMLGTSGTVTTLGGLAQNLGRYDRARVDGTYLSVTEIDNISKSLLNMSLSERAAQPCIGRERADLVLAGCAVLQAICRLWPVQRLRIADRGLREGILVDLIAQGRT